MSRLSTLATSTLTPALNVLATVLPAGTLLSLVRTNAPPLPGLTCWNSTTDHNCPSIFSTMPFFMSLVVATRRPFQLEEVSALAYRVQHAGGGQPLPRRPQSGGEGADDESFGDPAGSAEFGETAQTLDRDHHRDRRWVGSEDGSGDRQPFQDADPGSTPQHLGRVRPGRSPRPGGGAGEIGLGTLDFGGGALGPPFGTPQHPHRDRVAARGRQGQREDHHGADQDRRHGPAPASRSVSSRIARGCTARSSAHRATRSRCPTAWALTPRSRATCR